MKKVKVLFLYPNQFLGPEMTVYTQIIRHLDRSRFSAYMALSAQRTASSTESASEGKMETPMLATTGIADCESCSNTFASRSAAETVRQ